MVGCARHYQAGDVLAVILTVSKVQGGEALNDLSHMGEHIGLPWCCAALFLHLTDIMLYASLVALCRVLPSHSPHTVHEQAACGSHALVDAIL